MKITSLFCLVLIILFVSNGFGRSIKGKKKVFKVGDMKFDEFTYTQRHLPADSKLVSTGILGSEYRWPKNSTGQVQVPYIFTSSFSTSHRSIILAGMKLITNRTCVRFIPRTTAHANYLRIIDSDGCWSYVGKQGGVQDLSLSTWGCVTPDTAAHEFMHALGFDHMHSHAKRDNYIRVYLGNVTFYDRSQFDKVSPLYYNNFNTTYDFDSVMHYDRKSFSRNGLDTIYPLRPYVQYADSMGFYSELSTGDVARINNMYKC